MIDLTITLYRREEKALVHALTPKADAWLHETIFMRADDCAQLISLEGGIEIEQEARKAGLVVG